MTESLRRQEPHGNGLQGLARYSLQLKRLVNSTPPTKLVIVGLGNELRSDDFVGSYIALKLIDRQSKNKLSTNFCILDAKDNVESFITRIAAMEPDQVIFIDSCEFQGEPGEMQIAPVSQSQYPFFTTHGVPVKLLAQQFLPRSQCWLLAIQPKVTALGSGLSPTIKLEADSAVDAISRILNAKSQSPKRSRLRAHKLS